MGHVACKQIYVRIFRGSDKMHSNSLLSVGSWVAICLVIWVIAWVVAESIPVFNDLLSLIVSFDIYMFIEKYGLTTNLRARYSEVGSAVSYNSQVALSPNILTLASVGLPAIFWLYMNQGRYFQNWKKIVLTITNIGVLAIAFAIVSLTLPLILFSGVSLTSSSVVWAYTFLVWPSITTPAVKPGHVPTTHNL